jgi:hypothetical protein
MTPEERRLHQSKRVTKSWKKKTPEERRAHALMMVEAKRRKRAAQAASVNSSAEQIKNDV